VPHKSIKNVGVVPAVKPPNIACSRTSASRHPTNSTNFIKALRGASALIAALAANANRWADSLNKGVSMKKYVKGQYYWLDHEKTILSQCVRIDENEVAYFQIIGLSVLYTEKDFEVAIKATVK